MSEERYNQGQRPKLEVRSTKNKGRGVFACARFKEGDLLEAVPVIVIPKEQIPHIVATVLDLYVFKFGEGGEHLAIALGFGSLYNHSFLPNAEIVTSWDEERILFYALRDIEDGEEITHNYVDEEEPRPIWFDVEE